MKPYLFLSCLLLGAGISMSSLADTRVVDALWGSSEMDAVLSASAAFLYIVFGEYLVHRFVLHGRVFGNNKWRREHLYHHIVGDDDHWFGPSVIGGLLASSPLIAVIFYLTGIYGCIWSCCVILTYLCFSKAVHRSVHQPHFLRRMPWHNSISKPHEAHHRRPNCSFSLVFPFVDRVFGTTS